MTPDTAHREGPSANRQAATLELRGISKRYPGADDSAIGRRRVPGAPGTFPIPTWAPAAPRDAEVP